MFQEPWKSYLYWSNTYKPTNIFPIKYCSWADLTDSHLLTVTEFIMSFTLSKPRIITYRDYKKFNTKPSEIQSLSSSEANLGFFKDSVFHIFTKHAPITGKNLCYPEEVQT